MDEDEPAEHDAGAWSTGTAAAPALIEEAKVEVPEGALEVEVATDADGAGAAMVGRHADELRLGPTTAPGCTTELVAAHTTGISRVSVQGGPPDSTVTVYVVPTK